jgi:hypothetical protein
MPMMYTSWNSLLLTATQRKVESLRARVAAHAIHKYYTTPSREREGRPRQSTNDKEY